MRVLWVTDVFPHAGRPYKGAWMVDLARALSRHVEVVVLSPRYRFFYTPKGSFLEWYRGQSPVVDYGAFRAFYPVAPATPWAFTMAAQSVSMAWGLLPVARREHLRRRFDLVHGHFIIPGGFAAARIAKRLAIPTVLSAQGSDVNEFSRFPILKKLLLEVLRGCDHLTAVSRDLVGKLAGLDYHQAIWIPNGCIMGQASDECERIKGRIVFVGMLYGNKAPMTLLEAFRNVLGNANYATLDIIGEGPDLEDLRRRATSLGLGGAVRFLGPLPHDQVLSHMRRGDVFCLPSRREGWPLVLVEALAAGLPIVGSDIGGIREIVCRPELGILVPPGDPDALAKALLRALCKSWDREMIRGEARRYCWEEIAKRYLEVYHDAVASRRSRFSSAAMAGME